MSVLATKLVVGLCASAMAALADFHPLAVVGLLAFVSCLARREYLRKSRVLVAFGALGGVFSLLIPHRMLFGADHSFAANYPAILCAVWAWGLAVSVFILTPTARRATVNVIAVAATASAVIAACLWVGTAYAEALRGAFYLAIPATVCLLILLKQILTLSLPAIQVVNTCILVLTGIPLVDLVWAPPSPGMVPSAAKRFYAYEEARKDPVAFERWWHFFVAESTATLKQVLQGDPRRLALARAIPGAEADLFESRVKINSLGFRGREISRDKGEAYRIVALGESTTFGFTLERSDQPWPEVLENLIRERAGVDREVEVINAGIPGLTLKDNLRRFSADIAPLKPDMILSYHGYNGFHFLNESLPRSVGNAPPAFRPRALRLLAQAEYRARLLRFRRTQIPTVVPRAKPVPLANTELARLYDRLYEVAKTNHARLVIASHSMAVNTASHPEVIEFYRLGFPGVAWSIEANQANNELVRRFALSHPEVLYVDSTPGLEGQHEKFIDLVHLTQAGRNHIAEAFYAVIAPVLLQEETRARN
jgi:lysophospholipase L1-like esterase